LPWIAGYGPAFLDKLSRLASVEAHQHDVVSL
jgi:hypothetical protein